MRMATCECAPARAFGAALIFLIGLALLGCRTETGPSIFSDRLYLDTTHEPCSDRGKPIEIFQERVEVLAPGQWLFDGAVGENLTSGGIDNQMRLALGTTDGERPCL